ncbi:Putative SET-domain containing protein family [Zea mays]|jgi:hypothetical protein|uniref:Putative SET-domain containing protein family n=1 Tax=Zea mays TaxID=4577 RepID=A0A1D6ISQ5_MAIZE|nr:Putative SET-domain containing protein family [Zea mays]
MILGCVQLINQVSYSFFCSVKFIDYFFIILCHVLSYSYHELNFECWIIVSNNRLLNPMEQKNNGNLQ